MNLKKSREQEGIYGKFWREESEVEKWLHYTIITKIKEIFFLKNRTRKYRSSSTSRYESVHKGFKQNINRMGKEGISISKYESKNHL